MTMQGRGERRGVSGAWGEYGLPGSVLHPLPDSVPLWLECLH